MYLCFIKELDRNANCRSHGCGWQVGRTGNSCCGLVFLLFAPTTRENWLAWWWFLEAREPSYQLTSMVVGVGRTVVPAAPPTIMYLYASQWAVHQ